MDELEAIRARKLAELQALQAQKAAAGSSESPAGAGGVQEAGDGTLDQLLQNDLVFVDFWAPWCGPCRMFAPVFEAASREFAGKAVFAKVNVDDNPATSMQYRIQSIPTLGVFRNGKLVQRQAGAMPGPVFDAYVRQFL